MQRKQTADKALACLTGWHAHWTGDTQHRTYDQTLATEYNSVYMRVILSCVY